MPRIRPAHRHLRRRGTSRRAVRPRATGHRRATALLATAALAAALAACSHEPGLDSGPPDPAQASNVAPTEERPSVDTAPSAPQLASDPAVGIFRSYVDARYAAMIGLDPNNVEHAATSSAERLEFDRETIQQLKADGQTLHGAPNWQVVGTADGGASRRILLVCQWHGSGYFIHRDTGAAVQEVVEKWLPYQVWLINNGSGSLVVDHIYDGDNACPSDPPE